MNQTERPAPIRALLLITSPKKAKKASELFAHGAVPLLYKFSAFGTAPSEMIDILGLGTPDKSILITMLPKPFAEEMLRKLKKTLKIGTVDSGIAFTLPLSGANNLILHILKHLPGAEEAYAKKEEILMTDCKFNLIAAVVNRGYSEDVMDAARAAGASGGTVVNSRRVGNNDAIGFWGMSIQEEKEVIFIVAKKEDKLPIMRSIGEKCGIRSEAKGIVISLPIENVIGLEDWED